MRTATAARTRRTSSAAGRTTPARRSTSVVTRRAVAAPSTPTGDDLIYERLVTAIFEHRLPPGTKLGEEGLAAIFGVSRARVRAVLPRLAHEGLVTLAPNRGAFVTQPTVEQARDVFEARRLIEPGIAMRLARQPDRRAAVARLRKHVAAERKARNAGDARAIVRLSGEFHILLAELAGNALLAKALRELASLTCLIIALYDQPAKPSCLGEEHREIADAIADGDTRRVAALMVEHLNHVEQHLDLTGDDGGGDVDLAAALA
jgi:DNA-binding GntR family transcriptional regulator